MKKIIIAVIVILVIGLGSFYYLNNSSFAPTTSLTQEESSDQIMAVKGNCLKEGSLINVCLPDGQGGEVTYKGYMMTVVWNTSPDWEQIPGTNGLVDIDLVSEDNQRINIVSGLGNKGRYSWRVDTPPGKYRVSVHASIGGIKSPLEAQSDGYIEIR